MEYKTQKNDSVCFEGEKNDGVFFFFEFEKLIDKFFVEFGI